MFVEELWRYPVKSMRGEACQELHVGANGVVGDRAFGVLDLESGNVLSAKREGRLLEAAARWRGEQLIVELPNGDALSPGGPLNERLSTWLDRSVAVVEALTFGVATFEGHEDFEHDDSPLVSWQGSGGSFVDESPLHFLATADLDDLARERPELQWDVRRFRPNILVRAETLERDSFTMGQRVTFGDVESEVVKGCSRCVMTTRAQPNTIERQLDILRHVLRAHDGDVGVRAKVTRTGSVRVGDAVTLAS